MDPIIGKKHLTKVLMDGGCGLNILYVETLDGLGIVWSRAPKGAPFHSVVPGNKATPLGQIDLPITFRTPTNFRTETLTFELVEFLGTYHAILGQSCYAKFMAVSKYTYLKLKMLAHVGSSPSTGPSRGPTMVLASLELSLLR